MKVTWIFLCAALLSYCSTVFSFGTGAPTFGSVCSDLTQAHFPNVPTPCESDCPFSLVLMSIDGNLTVPTGRENLYRCGSTHTSELINFSYNS